jgi:RimJ/RimL family protein N-acetyltransferase
MKSSDIEIRQASIDEMKEFYGGYYVPDVIEVYGAFVNGKPIGVCGIRRDPDYFGTLFENDGRIIGFFDAKEDLKAAGLRAVLAMVAFLKKNKRTVYVQADTNNHKTASKLLKTLGFVETDETEKDARNPDNIMRLWKWQDSARSSG